MLPAHDPKTAGSCGVMAMDTETAEAAWVSMVMDRLHAAETQLAAAETRLAAAEMQLAATLPPPLAFGYRPSPPPSFFFTLAVPDSRFRDIDAVCAALDACPGAMAVSVMADGPYLRIEGMAHDPQVGSREAMSQLLERCLGKAEMTAYTVNLSSNSVRQVHTWLWDSIIMYSDIARRRIPDGGGWTEGEPSTISMLMQGDCGLLLQTLFYDRVNDVYNKQSRDGLRRVREYLNGRRF